MHCFKYQENKEIRLSWLTTRAVCLIHKHYFSVFMPIARCNVISMLEIGLGQQVEIVIVLLVKVFLLVKVKLVMEERLLLPVHVGLYCQQFHEFINLNIV